MATMIVLTSPFQARSQDCEKRPLACLVCLSVSPSACPNGTSPTGRVFVKLDV